MAKGVPVGRGHSVFPVVRSCQWLSVLCSSDNARFPVHAHHCSSRFGPAFIHKCVQNQSNSCKTDPKRPCLWFIATQLLQNSLKMLRTWKQVTPWRPWVYDNLCCPRYSIDSIGLFSAAQLQKRSKKYLEIQHGMPSNKLCSTAFLAQTRELLGHGTALIQ